MAEGVLIAEEVEQEEVLDLWELREASGNFSTGGSDHGMATHTRAPPARFSLRLVMTKAREFSSEPVSRLFCNSFCKQFKM